LSHRFVSLLRVSHGHLAIGAAPSPYWLRLAVSCYCCSERAAPSIAFVESSQPSEHVCGATRTHPSTPEYFGSTLNFHRIRLSLVKHNSQSAFRVFLPHSRVHSPGVPTYLISPTNNHIAVALELQSIANALELVVPILVLRPQTFSVLAQVEIFSVGSSYRPLQRTSAAAGYQERKIPKPLPYRPQLSSPLACCSCGTAHAPFGLLSVFQWISSHPQRLLEGALYCLELSRDPPDLRQMDQRIQSLSAPCCLTTTASAWQWSALPTLASSLSGGFSPLGRDRVSGFARERSPVGPFRCRPIFRKRFRWIEVEAGSCTLQRLVTAAPARLGARGYCGSPRLASGGEPLGS
jgi:hypothetical protein